MLCGLLQQLQDFPVSCLAFRQTQRQVFKIVSVLKHTDQHCS